MDILHRPIDDYLHRVVPDRDEVLAEMEELARERHFPIVGPLVGMLLHQLVLMKNPLRVFEMGSGFGYSAYWMAKALRRPEARVICTDGSRSNADQAQEFLRRGGVIDRIDYRVGDALEIIDQTAGDFDVIYNDIDKEQYPAAFAKAIPRLRPGGLFVTDNILWSGRVAEDDQQPSTLGIKELTRLLYGSPDLVTTIVPLRDGVAVALKHPAADQ